jgi:hypothetical protein
MADDAKTRPKSPPVWARILDHVISHANTSRLSERDWRIFYEFVRANRRKMSSVELERRLVAGGFTEDYAKEISCNYDGEALARFPVAPILRAHAL